jgi:NAD(P)-dependent dehydrogenase (short-subunit alcohol dehydrogenase family)
MTLPTQPRAVVTGAAGGLGRALCLALSRRRARIVISDIELQGAEETAHLVAQQGGQPFVRRCDVSRADDVEELAQFADRELGATDLLINNAGVAVAGAVGDVPLRDWEWIFGINLWGVIYGCHTFAPRFKQQRSGHVLNVASAAGLLSAPNMGPYNITKAGVISLSETLASELRPFGVGVTVLCPTFFVTGIMTHSRSQLAGDLAGSAQARMEKSKLQAPGVADRALASCDKGDLYCVPMVDGQLGWRLKGLAPEAFYKRVMPVLMTGMRPRAAKR